MSEVTEVSLKTFMNYINSDTLSVLRSHASWCGPCKQSKVPFEKLAKKYKDYKLNFITFEIEEHSDLTEALSITSLPTFRFYSNGKQIGEVKGANLTAVEDEIKTYISENFE